MKVIVNKPPMPVVPPHTYDLVNLSRGQMVAIKNALARTAYSYDRASVFEAVNGALQQ